ncbi:hypothetical protein TRVL_05178 [Trypanosoma vivax]|nr:hypothetical protein TRVL_05178 [Trypanosoma vivax]
MCQRVSSLLVPECFSHVDEWAVHAAQQLRDQQCRSLCLWSDVTVALVLAALFRPVRGCCSRVTVQLLVMAVDVHLVCLHNQQQSSLSLTWNKVATRGTISTMLCWFGEPLFAFASLLASALACSNFSSYHGE